VKGVAVQRVESTPNLGTDFQPIPVSILGSLGQDSFEGTILGRRIYTDADLDKIFSNFDEIMQLIPAVMVYDETVDLVEVAMYWSRFYSSESCGQCTNCREGTHWLERTFSRIVAGGGVESDIKMIGDMQRQMAGTTICVLSDAAVFYPSSLLRLFPEELARYIQKAKEVRSA